MMTRLDIVAVAAGCLLAAGYAQGQQTTAVSVFLPGYGDGDWSAYRGSIIGSASGVTTYTIFCAASEQAPPSCYLDADLPLTFAEGPSTLRYDGTLAGQITAHLSCGLQGKTAATCTGSSSYGTGFREGPITGPTVTAWTKTLSGTDVEWGVLSLTTPPATAATTDLEDGITPTLDPSYVTGTSLPTSLPTGGGGHSIARTGGLWGVFGAIVGAIAVLL